MNKLSKLASMTGEELQSDVQEIVAGGSRGYRQEVTGRADSALGEEEPVLSDAIRAMLIMYGCTAKFVGTYWLITRRSGIDQPPKLVLPPGRRWRPTTGVPVKADAETWQAELKSFIESGISA